MPLPLLLLVHVAISFVAIFAGFVVIADMLRGRQLDAWNPLFLATTNATTATGFLFPITQFTPALGVGIVSTVVLAAALVALYGMHLAGIWRAVYAVAAVLSLYLNVFVLIVQTFQKFLKIDVPKEMDPSFAALQGICFVAFLAIGFFAVRNFREEVVAE